VSSVTGKTTSVRGTRNRLGVGREQEVEDVLERLDDDPAEIGGQEVHDRGKNRVDIHGKEISLKNPPLPIRDGLNPSRVRLEQTTTAWRAVRRLIDTQQHLDPTDDATALRARFADGGIRLDDGTRLSPTSVVDRGQFIWFYRRPAPERHVPGELRLLYRDDDLLVVDKPPFMSTLPRGQHITETAVVRARRQFGLGTLSPAHRLDRLTRGVLLFTVRPEVRGPYQQLFERRAAQKVYSALTVVPEGWRNAVTGGGDGLLPVPAGALYAGSPATPLPVPTPDRPWQLRHRMIKYRGRMATFLEHGEPNSSTSVTGLRLIDRPDAALELGIPDQPLLEWHLEPHSGRTHQLRLNLRLFGAPILNDPLYSVLSDEALWNEDAPMPYVPSVDEEDFSRPMGLTARSLSFTDPLSGQPRLFTSSFR
jgi:tRNA pseudouridine32 synthase/23S rRNA pseudouridine746 synthase